MNKRRVFVASMALATALAAGPDAHERPSAEPAPQGERRHLSATQTADVTYVNIHVLADTRPHDCNTPDPALDIQMLRGFNAAPRFQFPAGKDKTDAITYAVLNALA